MSRRRSVLRQSKPPGAVKSRDVPGVSWPVSPTANRGRTCAIASPDGWPNDDPPLPNRARSVRRARERSRLVREPAVWTWCRVPRSCRCDARPDCSLPQAARRVPGVAADVPARRRPSADSPTTSRTLTRRMPSGFSHSPTTAANLAIGIPASRANSLRQPNDRARTSGRTTSPAPAGCSAWLGRRWGLPSFTVSRPRPPC